MTKSVRRAWWSCLVLGAALTPGYSFAQTRQMPSVTYQTDDYNEISTSTRRLETIVLRADTRSAVEAARLQILPVVLGCIPVTQDDRQFFYTICPPKPASDLPAIGRVLAQLEANRGGERVEYDIYLLDPKSPELPAARASYDEIVEMRRPPSRTRVDLAGGAYPEGYEIGSRRIEDTSGVTAFQIAIAPYYEWIGRPAMCTVKAQSNAQATDADFRGFFEKTMQDMRAAGQTVTSRGDTVSPVWKSASAIGQSVKNGATHQTYFRVIYWSRGGKLSTLTVYCELTADPKVRKIAEMVEKRLLVHSDLDR